MGGGVSRTLHFFSNAVVTPFTKATTWLGHALFPARTRTFSSSQLGRRGSSIRDVYLGGSLGSPWREQIAVPLLKKNGLNFFNPAVCSSSRLIPIEASAMDNSRVLLFVIQNISPDTVLDTGDIASKTAVKDYNRGRSYLSDFANREGVPVFDEIQEALECVISKCKASK